MPMDQRRLSRMLRKTFLRIKRKIMRAYADQGIALQPQDAHLLEQVALEPGLSPQEIARRDDIDKAYIARRVREMEQRGYLIRTPHPVDYRRIQLTITDAGSEEMERGLRTIEQAELSVFEALTEDELDTLYRLLAKCAVESPADAENNQ